MQMSTDKNQEDSPRVIETDTYQTGLAIYRNMSEEAVSHFKKGWWNDKLMQVAMDNDQLKLELFRFVDVLPYLSHHQSVANHLREYFCREGAELPKPLQWLISGATSTGLTSRLVAKTINQAVLNMAHRFITGATPTEALQKLKQSHLAGMGFTLDLLGEAVLSEKESYHYQHRYLELIDDLIAKTKDWPPLQERFVHHPMLNVSIKISAFYSQISSMAFETSLEALCEKLVPVFLKAKAAGVFITLDLEQYSLKNLTFALYKKLRSHPELRDYHNSGFVIQAYLKDAEADLMELLAWAKRENKRFTIRLVKGAYWDYEVINARQLHWPIPVYTNKAETDRNFEHLTDILFDHYPMVQTALGSHNIRSIAHAIASANHRGIPKEMLDFQMLFGMADPIKQALLKMGYFVREYATVGDLIPGMAYFVRRLLENTSNEGFLRKSFAEDTPPEVMLAPPKPNGKIKLQALTSVEDLGAQGFETFENAPATDFSRPQGRASMRTALHQDKTCGIRNIGPIINGEHVPGEVTFRRENPSRTSEIVTDVILATEAQAKTAFECCEKAGDSWAATPAQERARILRAAAKLMTDDRFRLAAIEVREIGKPWREADGDLIEAIDFLNYYADSIERLAKPRKLGGLPGEGNDYVYRPKGQAVVISPWNFPLAIPTGQVAGALAAGCPVIFKPSTQASLIGHELVTCLHRAGVPKEILHFMPCQGSTVGNFLVNHPQTQIIAFTGSMEVGQAIIQAAATPHPNQRHIKKVIAELGGKNAIIIDSDADLDEALVGTLYSAFGFAGQKCSACSRIIVLEENYDRFIQRFSEAVKSITVGPADDPSVYYGPVIDKKAKENILRYIEIGKSEANLLSGGTAAQEGHFIAPHLFSEVTPKARIAQEEIFGPVVSIFKVKDIEEALDVANGTRFALTGGFFSRSPTHIKLIREKFRVGNLYINRGCTGAIVNRQPFGGFKMSGIGSKAGGPDYLLQFMDPVTITENTLRRGFSPETIATEKNG